MNYKEGSLHRQHLIARNNQRLPQQSNTTLHLFTGIQKSHDIEELLKEFSLRKISITTHLGTKDAEQLIDRFNGKSETLILIFDISPERQSEYAHVFTKYSQKIEHLYFLTYPAKSKFQSNYSFDNAAQIIEFCQKFYKKTHKIKLSSVQSLSKDKNRLTSTSLNKNGEQKLSFNKLFFQIELYNDYDHKGDFYYYESLVQALGEMKKKAVSFNNIRDLQIHGIFKNKKDVLILTSTNRKSLELLQVIKSKKTKHVHLILFGQLKPSTHYLDQSVILATNNTQIVINCLAQSGFNDQALANFKKNSFKSKYSVNSVMYRSSLHNMRGNQNSESLSNTGFMMRGSIQDQQKPVHHWMIDKQTPNSPNFSTFEVVNSNIKVQRGENKVIKSLKSPIKQNSDSRQRRQQPSNIQKLYDNNIVNSDKIIYNNGYNSKVHAQSGIKSENNIVSSNDYKPLAKALATALGSDKKNKLYPSNIIHQVSQQYRGSNVESIYDHDTSLRMLKNLNISGLKNQSHESIKNISLQQNGRSNDNLGFVVQKSEQIKNIKQSNIIQLNTNNYIHQNINNYGHDGSKIPSFNYVNVPETIIVTDNASNKRIYTNHHYVSPPKIYKKQQFIPEEIYIGSPTNLSNKDVKSSERRQVIKGNTMNIVKRSAVYTPVEVNNQASKTTIEGNIPKSSEHKLVSEDSKKSIDLHIKKNEQNNELANKQYNTASNKYVASQSNKRIDSHQQISSNKMMVNEHNRAQMQDKHIYVARGNQINLKHHYASPIDQLRPFNSHQAQLSPKQSPQVSPRQSSKQLPQVVTQQLSGNSPLQSATNNVLIKAGGINLQQYERMEQNGQVFYRKKKNLISPTLQDQIAQQRQIKKAIVPLVQLKEGQVKYQVKYFNESRNKPKIEMTIKNEISSNKQIVPLKMAPQYKHSQKKISSKYLNALNESNMFSRMSELHSDGSILRRNNIRFGVKLSKKAEVSEQSMMQSKLMSGIYKFNQPNKKNTINKIIRGEEYIEQQNRKLFHINTSFNNFHFIIYEELQYLKKTLQAYVCTHNDKIELFTGTEQLFECIRPQKVEEKFDAGFIFLRLQDLSNINTNLLPEDYYIFTIEKSQQGILQINDTLKRVRVDQIRYLPTVQKIIIDKKLYQYVAYRNNKHEIQQLADKFLQSEFILEKIQTEFSSQIIDFYYCELPRFTRLYLLCDQQELSELLKLISIYEEFNPHFNKESCKLICILSDILKNDELIMSHPKVTFISNPDGIERHEDILKYAHHSQEDAAKIIAIDNIFYHQKLPSLENKIHFQFPGRFNIFAYTKLQDVYLKIDRLAKLQHKNSIKQKNYLVLHESMNNQHISIDKLSKVFMYGKAKVMQGQVVRVLNAEELFQLLKI